MKNFLLASGSIDNPFNKLGVTGPISAPTDPNKPGAYLFLLLGNLFQMVIVIAGLYALWNFLLAGWQYIGAGGDPKNVTKAQEKITQTIIGLVIAAGSVTIAAVIGYLVFKDVTFLITPRIVTPT